MHSIPGLKKKTWHFNPGWVLGDISVFPMSRYLSIECECFFSLFISPFQTVALTRSCWSKWKSWRCGVFRQQRLGICKLHFNCSPRQSRSCLGELQPITTGHRPCGCRGTQQVHATNSIITFSIYTTVCRHIRSSVWDQHDTMSELCLSDALCQLWYCTRSEFPLC